MPKLRKEFTQDFTIIYNTILRDNRVGSSPRGVYCTMVSMSDGWNFTIRGLAGVMGEGVTKIANALKKLEETKYVHNFESYLVSTLFNEANSKRFRDNAESRWAEYAVKRDFGGHND